MFQKFHQTSQYVSKWNPVRINWISLSNNFYCLNRPNIFFKTSWNVLNITKCVFQTFLQNALTSCALTLEHFFGYSNNEISSGSNWFSLWNNFYCLKSSSNIFPKHHEMCINLWANGYSKQEETFKYFLNRIQILVPRICSGGTFNTSSEPTSFLNIFYCITSFRML